MAIDETAEPMNFFFSYSIFFSFEVHIRIVQLLRQEFYFLKGSAPYGTVFNDGDDMVMQKKYKFHRFDGGEPEEE